MDTVGLWTADLLIPVALDIVVGGYPRLDDLGADDIEQIQRRQARRLKGFQHLVRLQALLLHPLIDCRC
jgi:hypothetical protein